MPGLIVCVQTFGSVAHFHPHLHVLMSDGGFGRDGWALRTAAVQHNVPCITTLAGAAAAAAAIEARRGDGDLQVLSLQELHAAKQPV